MHGNSPPSMPHDTHSPASQPTSPADPKLLESFVSPAESPCLNHSQSSQDNHNSTHNLETAIAQAKPWRSFHSSPSNPTHAALWMGFHKNLPPSFPRLSVRSPPEFLERSLLSLSAPPLRPLRRAEAHQVHTRAHHFFPPSMCKKWNPFVPFGIRTPSSTHLPLGLPATPSPQLLS